ncbi:MAG: hypothetical protein ABW194_06885 [Novosphingobium sp.]
MLRLPPAVRLATILALASAAPAVAQDGAPARAASPAEAAGAALTYADLADLADASALVARVRVRGVIRLKPEQAPGVRPGMARLLVEARTGALLVGSGLAETITYLADVPLDARGRVPNLKKRDVLIFARPVGGRPGQIQLVAPDAQVPWSQPLEDRVRAILTELVAPGAAPRVLAVREAMHVPGNLLDEGETQVFLTTPSGDPVSLTVVRRPGTAPAWGVALGEIVDQAARPPARDSLTWYRLACFLPENLSPATILASGENDRRKAADDYRFVRRQLGACPRSRPAEWRGR